MGEEDVHNIVNTGPKKTTITYRNKKCPPAHCCSKRIFSIGDLPTKEPMLKIPFFSAVGGGILRTSPESILSGRTIFVSIYCLIKSCDKLIDYVEATGH
jgi:hypothetical protein